MEIINMDEQEMSKYSIGTISMKTWISTGLTIVLIINQITEAAGIDTPITKLMGNLGSDNLSFIIGCIGIVAAQLYTWWHNNSITKVAQAADHKFGLTHKNGPETKTLIPVTMIVNGVSTTVYSEQPLTSTIFSATPIDPNPVTQPEKTN